MTTEQSLSATWDAMTDAQKTEWLAVNVMGWRIENYAWVTDECTFKAYQSNWASGFEQSDRVWNPLTDWNHTIEVVGKVIATNIDYLPTMTAVFGIAFANVEHWTQGFFIIFLLARILYKLND